MRQGARQPTAFQPFFSLLAYHDPMNGVDPHGCLAARMLDAARIPLADHAVMRENVATLLAQLPDTFVETLAHEPPEELLTTVNRGYGLGQGRWVDKIRREIEHPYDDQRVFDHLQELQDELRGRAAEVVAASHGAWPCKFYVAGSLLKGRFGGNSDLDVLCETDCGIRWWSGTYPHDDVHVQFLDQPEAASRDRFRAAFGCNRPLDPQQDGFLTALCTDALERKGYHVASDAGGRVQVTAPAGPVQREKETPPPEAGLMMWSFADLPV